jgi:hypothetical protein
VVACHGALRTIADIKSKFKQCRQQNQPWQGGLNVNRTEKLWARKAQRDKGKIKA